MFHHPWKRISTVVTWRVEKSARANSFKQRRSLLCIGIVLLWCVDAQSQQPQPTPRFAFLHAGKVTLTPGGEPFKLLIQNNTTETLTIDLKVVDLEPKAKGAISTAVKLEPATVRLEPLASWAVAISPPVKDTASTPQVFGTGYLIGVESGKPNFDRREIEIAETKKGTPPGSPAMPAPADALEALTLQGINFVPSLFSSFWSALAWVGVAAMLVWRLPSLRKSGPLVGSVLITLSAIVLIGGALLDHYSPFVSNVSFIKVRPVPFTLGEGANAGVITAEGSVGRIVADGTQLTVTSLPRAGSYAGNLKLGPEKDARSVKVSLNVWDWWPFALLSIILGVYLGYRMSLYFKQQRGEDGLRLRIAQLWEKIVEDESRFQAEHGGRPFAAYRVAELAQDWLVLAEKNIAEHDAVAAGARLDRITAYANLFAQFRAQLVSLFELQSRAWERIRQNAFGHDREDVRVIVLPDKLYAEAPLNSATEDEQGTQLKGYQGRIQALIDWIGTMDGYYVAIVGFLKDAATIDKTKLTDADQLVLTTQIRALEKAVRDVLLADSKDKLTTYYNSAVGAINAIRELQDKASGESLLAMAADRSLQRDRSVDRDSAVISDIQLSSPLTSTILALEGNQGTITDLFVFTAKVILPLDQAKSYRLKWDFDDGSAPVFQTLNSEAGNRTLQIAHRYSKGGSYTASLQKFSGEKLGQHKVSVSQSPSRVERLLSSLRQREWQMTIVSGVLTVGLGFFTLYLNKSVWGTTADYLYAVLWGSVLSEGLKYAANMVGRIWNP